MRILIFSLILIHSTCYAELDAASQKGLADTKALLTNPAERQMEINKDPKARDVDTKVDVLTGSSGTKNDIYEVSASLMDKIVNETDGDPDKMKALMKEAQANPEAFYKKYFNEANQLKVHEIARKISADKAFASPPK